MQKLSSKAQKHYGKVFTRRKLFAIGTTKKETYFFFSEVLIYAESLNIIGSIFSKIICSQKRHPIVLTETGHSSLNYYVCVRV